MLRKDSLNNKDVYNDIVKKFTSTNSEALYLSPAKNGQKPDYVLPQRKEDFVYLPHRACLTI